MTYQVLARKWRPRNFEQMVGQEHILRMLTNALDQKRLHHAYLFTGTRGVGKTTVARILAKCLNCETGITAAPCGACKICTAIDAGRFLDLIEVDAASRTRVEDTRELLDNVNYQPAQGRYKIYLIDEVHMLSGHSFNALLKTLEEPPPYVIFLLATTDPKRLPITILSRCLQFNLKRVPVEQIASHLQQICTTEHISFETPALELLAHAADGSLRDALSLLDQTIAFCREKITTADTRQMLGTIEQDHLYRLLHALADQDGMQLLAEIQQLAEQAANFNQALEDLLSILHRICILQVIHDLPEQNEQLLSLMKRFTAEEIQLYYQIALIGRRDLPLAPNPQQGFEMVMLRMLAFQPDPIDRKKLTPTSKETKSTTEIRTAATVGRTTAVVSSTASIGSVTAIADSSVTTDSSTAIETSTVASAKPAGSSTAQTESSDWANMLSKLELTGMTNALASNCTLTSLTENKMTLALAVQHQTMLNKKLTERIEQAVSRYLNKEIKLEIIITTTAGETPSKQQQKEQAARQSAAAEAIKHDSDIQKIMGMFDATLASVTPGGAV